MTTYEVGLEQEKTDKIAAVAALGREVASELGQDPEAVSTFLWHYFRHVDPADLEDRTVTDLLDVVESHYREALVREPGQDVVSVTTPGAGPGGVGGATVLQIVTDDLPFLVDSVTMEVLRQGWTIREVFHPQFLVLRSAEGRLERLLRSAQAEREPGTLHESWMHLELLPPARLHAENAAAAELEQGIREVLDLVEDAVGDWRAMRERAVEVAAELRAGVDTDGRAGAGGEADQARELIEWLVDGHFTFLGVREYDLVGGGDGDDVQGEERYVVRPGTGLGILRRDNEPDAFSALPRHDAPPALLVVTKGNTRSRVHRPAYLDYIGVRRFDEQGRVVGEHRFLGLFATTAYSESVMRVPVLRQKAQAVIAVSGYDPASHGGKAIVDTLETYPRDELFQTPLPQLADTVERIAHLKERRQVRIFVRADPYGRFVSCLVYLPRDRYTGLVRRRMEQVLLDRLGGASIDDSARVTDAVLARLHIVVRMPERESADALDQRIDLRGLERDLTNATRTWDDEFADLLSGTTAADRLGTLLHALPEGYKADYTPRQGRLDLGALADLQSGADMALALYAPDRTPGRPVDEADLRLKIFRRDESLSLSRLLPHLSRLGVDVIDERPYELDAGGEDRAWIYDFGLTVPGGAEAVARDWGPEARERFMAAFRAAYEGTAESDAFCALVMAAGLGWREVSVLRAIGHYLRQGGVSYSQTYMAQALAANTAISRQLFDLFAVRFDPALELSLGERGARADELGRAVETALDDVSSLDQDRIVRSFLSVLRALVRTNFYRPGCAALALKLLPRQVPDLPEPRPAYEIFVHSPRIEGVHLRFGLVARGGLRWSDRAEDFRTEILGLVKAQTVKNTVIVPTGAKGGFVPRRLPDVSDREAWLAEGIACYQIFITSLLDVTDNLAGTTVVPAAGLVRHDGDDPYLVVAADKGTATFSDIANAISLETGFWLGDAFASGGSAGYDHKAMGITARGAWCSVEQHFRELGINPDADDFTCVGIGDMSGDVFGNGMLLSEHIKLVVAFDHRHVFVDPDPDPAVSFAERRRMFELPRSSWADYDASLISPGGGVFPRTLKSITVTEPMRRALGLADDVTTLDPTSLINLALKAPVDLLWNGGIGTYVKAEVETNADVGDKANDALRVNGAQLRARCVGEGGNLGLTQRGRIEYAACGGKINTDFIDNSAGVDTSDHEVNIKILLAPDVEDGSLTLPDRNTLLASMTDDVAHLVLAHNVSQNLALANAEAQAPSMALVHGEWIERLEEHGLIDREIEFLPDEETIEARRSKNRGLTSPELAVLLAYTKIVLSDEIGRSDVPDDPDLAARLVDYFPPALRETYTDQMRAHRLHREIVTTTVVNAFVDQAGITCFHRLSTETGADAADLVRAQIVARELFDAAGLETRIAALDHVVGAEVQTRMRLVVRTFVERVTRWLANERPRPLAIDATVDELGPGVAAVVASLRVSLGQREAKGVTERADELRSAGVPTDLADDVAALPTAYGALSGVVTALREGLDPVLVARVHHELAQRLGFDRLLARIIALPRDDRWSTMARAALRDDLHIAHARLTAQVVRGLGASADELVDAWFATTPAADDAASTIRSVLTGRTDLARASVALRVVRSLVDG